MAAQQVILALTGESYCGKTTLCTRVASLARARGLVVSGLLTLPRLAAGRRCGLDVEDIASGERRPLAEPVGSAAGPATEQWSFRSEALTWGDLVLRRATPCDLLIIDELGPLELVRDEGWRTGLDLLKLGGYRLALVVVRPALLPRLAERLDGTVPVVWTVTRANRNALPEQIVALLGGRR